MHTKVCSDKMTLSWIKIKYFKREKPDEENVAISIITESGCWVYGGPLRLTLVSLLRDTVENFQNKKLFSELFLPRALFCKRSN